MGLPVPGIDLLYMTAFFCLAVALPGWALYKAKGKAWGQRAALLAAASAVALAGLWAVAMTRGGAEGWRPYLSFWIGPVEAFGSLEPGLKAWTAVALLALLGCGLQAWRKAKPRDAAHFLLALSFYWSLCFGVLGR